MKEMEFKFVLENKKTGSKIVTELYNMKDMLENGFDSERVYEDLEEKYGCDGSCKTESCNHCECGPVFDEYEIVKTLRYIGRKDKSGMKIFDGDALNFLDAEYYSSESGSDWVDVVSTGVISWDEDRLGWDLSGRQSVEIDEVEFETSAIIGNVNSNPDLVKS